MDSDSVQQPCLDARIPWRRHTRRKQTHSESASRNRPRHSESDSALAAMEGRNRRPAGQGRVDTLLTACQPDFGASWRSYPIHATAADSMCTVRCGERSPTALHRSGCDRSSTAGPTQRAKAKRMDVGRRASRKGGLRGGRRYRGDKDPRFSGCQFLTSSFIETFLLRKIT
jgi:hypothetical protein